MIRIKFNYIAAAIILFTLAIYLWPQTFFIMLIKSFMLQIGIALIALVLLASLKKKWFLSLSSLICGLLLLNITSKTAPIPLPQQQIIGNIKIAHFNVLKYNVRYQKTIDEALDTQAHFISFQEVDQKWAKVLTEQLSCDYPYFKLEPRENTLGLAVFSKYPFSEIVTKLYKNIPTIFGSIQLQNQVVNFASCHTRAPVTVADYTLRNGHMQWLANHIRSQYATPYFVTGDFNAVPWDENIKNFKRDSNLLDSRKTNVATYPAWLPIAGIPIDYIFYSPNMFCKEFKKLNHHGSDHYGVFGEYVLVG